MRHRSRKTQKHPSKRSKPFSRPWTLSAIGASIVAGLVLVGGFAYGAYAAFGGVIKGQSSLSSPGGSGANTTTNANSNDSGNSNDLGGLNSAIPESSSPGSDASDGLLPGNGTSDSSSSDSAASNAPVSNSGISNAPVSNTAPSGTTNSGALSSAPARGSQQTIHLVALGDSLAHGFGDASGKGFVGDVTADYRDTGHHVLQSNLGIDGLTSSGLLQELRQASVESVLKSATVILVSIGGNDLNNAAGLPNINTQKIGVAKTQFQKNLTAILTKIRADNPNAPILLIGLYNPYADISIDKSQTDSIVQSWDAMEQQITEKFSKTVVVPTFDLFELHEGQFLYFDHFHPNQQGYERIAVRIWQDLQAN